jgi:hypothetical protein
VFTTKILSQERGAWKIALIPPGCEAPQPKPPPAPPSIQVFIARAGGIDPDYNRGMWAGELRHMRDSGKQGLMPGVLNRGATKTFEEMAEACFEAGYLTEPDMEEMLFMLAKDIEACLTGDRVNRVYGHSGEDFRNSLAYERWCIQQEPEEDESCPPSE